MYTCILGARRVVQLSLLLAGLSLMPWAMASSVTEKGEVFERTVEEHGQRYGLIGSGVFRYMIWTAYAGAYYQLEGETQPQPLSDVPRRLELAYFHAIDASDFAEATEKTLKDTLTLYEFNQIKEPLARLNQRYRDVVPGDRYLLSWNGEQLRLALNGEVLLEEENAEFASAMFSIWLGERPLGEGFRDALLGIN
ncbi:chalcone isomerase family protein [Halomonas sp. ISL-60]|uniref:chalcone isomerase family protein n=1 Tax=Halomonas sp. ISL-56 TaxID=2819149 RepID=UPI001BE9F79D|nr:chalcone isomerase family protein [Halomonas sp. ISL-56]MBT2771228.1 chalcone isomerase family protein [Halomonas sp. ISL-60]MBT2802827.1 chalcone isomerase family protein [Halomonas sp. ISL-56]